MKPIINIFIALFFAANLISAQDTLYVYKAGKVAYKSAVNTVDSVSFMYIEPVEGTLNDNDGHTYTYKKIGTQFWMTENLKTTKYRNGDAISNPLVDADWNAATYGAWCNYNNDAANGTKYGKLYNWYAVNDSRKIAPTGWHVATDAEWTILETYVYTNYGTSISAVKALATTTDWTTNGTAGTIGNNLAINNYSGFSALPGGYRSSAGGTPFWDIVSHGYWWSTTESDASYAWYRSLRYDANGVGWYYATKSSGFSVRCVRDSQ